MTFGQATSKVAVSGMPGNLTYLVSRASNVLVLTSARLFPAAETPEESLRVSLGALLALCQPDRTYFLFVSRTRDYLTNASLRYQKQQATRGPAVSGYPGKKRSSSRICLP